MSSWLRIKDPSARTAGKWRVTHARHLPERHEPVPPEHTCEEPPVPREAGEGDMHYLKRLLLKAGWQAREDGSDG